MINWKWLKDLVGWKDSPAAEPDPAAEHRQTVLADLRRLRDDLKVARGRAQTAQDTARADYRDLQSGLAAKLGVSVAALDKFALARLLDEAAVRVRIRDLTQELSELEEHAAQLTERNELGDQRPELIATAMKASASDSKLELRLRLFEARRATASIALNHYQLLFPYEWDSDPVLSALRVEIEQLLMKDEDAPPIREV